MALGPERVVPQLVFLRSFFRALTLACLVKNVINTLTLPVLSVNREIDEEFHLSLFICHLILIIAGGDLDSMSNVHRAISRPMTNEQ
jgi:hypothetical protein